MNPLTSRIITTVSAGLLIFEIIQGHYLIRLDSSNSSVDSIIIIAAMTGLFLGICIPETQMSDSASPDAATSPAETTISGTNTDRAENSEDDKSEG